MTDPQPDQPTQPKTIELLTCSARDYAEMMNCKLDSYVPVGLHSKDAGYEHLASLACRAREKGCEVVVNLRPVPQGSYPYLIATGLIRKKQSDEQLGATN